MTIYNLLAAGMIINNTTQINDWTIILKMAKDNIAILVKGVYS
jgi:hypothetical protein